MVVTVHLKIRVCDVCGHEAVALDGSGTPCTSCDSGEYVAWNGDVLETDVPDDDLDHIAELNEVIAWQKS